MVAYVELKTDRYKSFNEYDIRNTYSLAQYRRDLFAKGQVEGLFNGD